MKRHRDVPRIILCIGLLAYCTLTAEADSVPAKTSFTAAATFSAVGQIQFNTELRNRADDSTASALAWSALQLPAAWTVSDTYIQLYSTITAVTGGIMIYTDNKGAAAAPKATGLFPSGLVDHRNSDKTLPLAWSIVDSSPIIPAPDDPEISHLNYTGQWFLMKDPGAADITGAHGKLIPGESYATVKNGDGIHFSHFAANEYKPAASPDAIALEANFLSATTPNVYSATVCLEAYVE